MPIVSPSVGRVWVAGLQSVFAGDFITLAEDPDPVSAEETDAVLQAAASLLADIEAEPIPERILALARALDKALADGAKVG